ncbi:peptidoglycan-associated lipoprotein Pal [Piscinibacter sakaiensis]|nr:peptidoglycan-associated lipoprotein Pal [Piscinibacter sakaiensis]
MMTKSTLSLAALAAAALLAGCSSPVKLDTPAPVETRTPGAAGSGGAAGGSAGAGGSTGAAGQSGVASVDLSKSGAAGAAGNLQRTVYFDFDSFVVKDDYRPVVESNAKALSADRTRKVSVEGHTDERGSREYNLALGQKRAEAVTRAMALLGANDSQMEAVSFGKERPAVSGSGEEAWAKNRRAEIVSR